MKVDTKDDPIESHMFYSHARHAVYLRIDGTSDGVEVGRGANRKEAFADARKMGEEVLRKMMRGSQAPTKLKI